MMDEERPPTAKLVAGAWEDFQARVLPAFLEAPTPPSLELAQISYYAGAFALLGILGAAIDGAESEEAVALVREDLGIELDEYFQAREAELR